MKIFLILVMLQLAGTALYAQNTVKRFCEVNISQYGVKIDFGQKRKSTPFRDTFYANKLLRVESFSGTAEILNYMSDLGWKYEWSISDINNHIRVIFSKEFDHKALVDE